LQPSALQVKIVVALERVVIFNTGDDESESGSSPCETKPSKREAIRSRRRVKSSR
jgi:hypothetical protein